MKPQDTQTDPGPRPDLKVSEFAAHVGASPDTVRTLIRTGQISAYRLGRQVRIPAAELDRIRTTQA